MVSLISIIFLIKDNKKTTVRSIKLFTFLIRENRNPKPPLRANRPAIRPTFVIIDKYLHIHYQHSLLVTSMEKGEVKI